MERHEIDDHKQLTFVFSDPNGEARAAVHAYYSGAMCKAVVFYQSLRELKQIIHQDRGGQR